MRSAFAMALAISMSAAAPPGRRMRPPLPPLRRCCRAAPAPAAPARPRRPNAPIRTRSASTRTVQIDTTGGPGFGFQHFKAYDFLRDHEVVLTFDDGPWPGNTERVLKALADQCTKAMFFPIGKHAGWHPEILKQVAAAGHTIGSHTWSHKDLTQADAGRGQGRDRKGHRRGEHRARQQAGRPVLPLPGAAPSAGDGQISRRAQHRHLLDRLGLVRLQDAQARAGHQIGDGPSSTSTAKASS